MVMQSYVVLNLLRPDCIASFLTYTILFVDGVHFGVLPVSKAISHVEAVTENSIRSGAHMGNHIRRQDKWIVWLTEMSEEREIIQENKNLE